MLFFLLFCLVQITAAETHTADAGMEKWIINGGSSGNLPTGSLIGVAVALERGARAISLDLVLSADDQVVLLAEPRLEELTNVAEIYPDRARADGSYYSFDFTLAELKQMSHRQRSAADGLDNSGAVQTPQFPVVSLREVFGYLDLLANDPADRPTLVCELQKGWLHRLENKDLVGTVMSLLETYLASAARADLYIASWDPEELHNLAENNPSAIGLIQLIGLNDGAEVMNLEFGQLQPYNYDLMFTRFGLKAVSGYAAAVGLLPQALLNASGELVNPNYLDDAHTLGLKVIGYDADPGYLAGSAVGQTEVDRFAHLLFTVGFDGLVTSRDAALRSWLAERTKDQGSNRDNSIERLIEQIEESGISPSAPLPSDTIR